MYFLHEQWNDHSIIRIIITWEGNLFAQKMKFSIKDIFIKCDQIHSFLHILSYLLKKSLMENLIFLCSTSSSSPNFCKRLI